MTQKSLKDKAHARWPNEMLFSTGTRHRSPDVGVVFLPWVQSRDHVFICVFLFWNVDMNLCCTHIVYESFPTHNKYMMSIIRVNICIPYTQIYIWNLSDIVSGNVSDNKLHEDNKTKTQRNNQTQKSSWFSTRKFLTIKPIRRQLSPRGCAQRQVTSSSGFVAGWKIRLLLGAIDLTDIYP